MAVMMTNEQKLLSYKQRMAVLIGRGEKNMKSPGVVSKLKRRISKLEDLDTLSFDFLI